MTEEIKNIQINESEDNKTSEEMNKKINEEIIASPKAMDLPVLELEEYEIPHEETENIVDESNGSVKFAFIGCGQGGSRIAQSFYDIGYHKTIVLNTTPHDLEFLSLPKSQKLLMNIGELGAGKNMDRGNEATVKYRQEIFDMMRKMFGKIDHIIITIGAGGGTGGGSVLCLIEIAKRYMKYLGYEDNHKRVGVLMSLPTDGEASSPQVSKNAWHVLDNMAALAHKNLISPVITIDNDKIKHQYRGLTAKEFWPKINNTIAGLFHIFNIISNQDSPYTSFDPVDYKSILGAGGFMVLGLTSVKKFDEEQDISHAIKNNLNKTLLAEGFDLSTATVAGSIAVGGKKIMAEEKGLMDKLNYGFDCLSNMCDKATIHRGIYEDNREALRLYTIIGGLRVPLNKFQKLKGE